MAPAPYNTRERGSLHIRLSATLLRAYWRLGGAWSAVAILITLLAWQAVSLTPGPGLDSSWQAGLSMAIHQGLPFGSRAIFTYGPLGFLVVPSMWYGGLGIASFAYLSITRFVLALLLFASVRRTFGRAGGFVVAVGGAAVAAGATEPVIALLALVLATGSAPRERTLVGLAAAAGALAGLELLAKISVGITIAGLNAVFVLTAGRVRRRLLVAAVLGFGVAVLTGWLASGQPLTALGDYVKNSAQVVAGYSGAMSIAIGGLGWQGTAAVIGLLLGVWGALHSTEPGGSRERGAVLLLWLVFWFFEFKEGFVRHDSGHAALFFQALLGGFLAFSWRATHRLSALAGGAALLAFALAAEGGTLGSVIHPVKSVHAALGEVRDVVSGPRRARIVATGRAQIEAAEPIDAVSQARLRGHKIAPYPTEVALAWAYGLEWDPLPVLQSYQANTSALDDVDAEFLRSKDAPDRILFQRAPGIDDRALSFDEPATNRTMLCRYRELRVTTEFDVLARSTSRCGATTPLGTVHGDWGQSIPVPAPPTPKSLVFVRITGAGLGGLEHLRALLFKPAERFVVVNGDGRFRFITGTAGDGLPLRAARGVDYTAPFNFAPGARTIAVLKQDQRATGRQPLTYAFFAQSFTAAAPAAGRTT